MSDRLKFTSEIGLCASMNLVEGHLVIEELNGNPVLVVKDANGTFYRLHEFVPRSLVNKKVVIHWSGKGIVLKEK